MRYSNDRVTLLHVNESILQTEEGQQLLLNERAIKYRDAWHIGLPEGEAWYFDYGVVVFWGVNEDEKQGLLNRLNLSSTVDNNHDHFRFKLSEPSLRISQDTIFLTNDEVLCRLAISHAFAQSLKLQQYEQKAQQTIQDNSKIPKALSQSGKISLKRKEIAKIRGELFSTKSDIILHYGLLDTPEFFWEYPEYEEIYNIGARYLEIHQRVNLLSKKLETIHELFEMLADEEKHKHSAFLEWIVIILIAIEVVIFLLQEIKGLFNG